MDLMRAVLRSPVAQYLAIGLLAVGITLWTTELLAGQAARREALADARSTTELLAHGVAEPALPEGLVQGRIAAVDRFDRVVLDRLLTDGVVRLKIWRGDGTILYSDDTRLLGERFPLGEEEREILRDGGSDAEVSDLTQPENRYEPRGEGLVEVYTRIVSPGGESLLFETYYAADGIDARQAEVMAPFRRIIATALAIVIGIATAMLWVMTRRAKRAARERERLLRNAATASDAERRRIARDLHDGVVQDLAASAFALSTIARSVPEGEATALTEIGGSLRTSMKSLRSLLVEIHPPDLTTSSLPAALTDLVAPVEAAGVRARVEIGPLGDVDPAALALVWRVAQEAVRNSLRHAEAGRVEIAVTRDADRLTLVVADDGRGFDPVAVRAGSRYGLRGLQSLATDSGAELAVESGPGRGTVVRLEVPA